MVEILRAEQKTVIIIAHRLSTVLHADKIVVISDGNVMEEGKHDELLINRKHYYELWKQQFPMLVDFV
jgi:ATP-binding cassette subfamily B protein